MKVQTTRLDGVLLIEPQVYGDSRGFFFETWREPRFHEAGITETFLQDSLSRSEKGVLRGLHFQLRHPQAKLVTVIRGEIFDVAVDIRRGSPTFGQWCSAVLSDDNHHQLYIPPGFAHGFYVLSDIADVYYKFSDIYHPEDEASVIWNDPQIGIEWPDMNITISEKDNRGLKLSEFDSNNLPVYGE